VTYGKDFLVLMYEDGECVIVVHGEQVGKRSRDVSSERKREMRRSLNYILNVEDSSKCFSGIYIFAEASSGSSVLRVVLTPAVPPIGINLRFPNVDGDWWSQSRSLPGLSHGVIRNRYFSTDRRRRANASA
jgi:hypothetical protein